LKFAKTWLDSAFAFQPAASVVVSAGGQYLSGHSGDTLGILDVFEEVPLTDSDVFEDVQETVRKIGRLGVDLIRGEVGDRLVQTHMRGFAREHFVDQGFGSLLAAVRPIVVLLESRRSRLRDI